MKMSSTNLRLVGAIATMLVAEPALAHRECQAPQRTDRLWESKALRVLAKPHFLGAGILQYEVPEHFMLLPVSEKHYGFPLTGDGLELFSYDGWNRLVKATRRLDALTTVATYAYDGLHRRIKKVVSNSGSQAVPGDGGNTTVFFYYDSQWRILETRNGSDQTTAQFLPGWEYTDQYIFVDVQGDGSGNDVDPDVTAGGETANLDHRYFFHQDRNWNVIALTDYASGGGGSTGEIVARFSYSPYGEFVVQSGLSGGGAELGQPKPNGRIGLQFAHQGLWRDAEKGSYQNRHREYVAGLQRFEQRNLATFRAYRKPLMNHSSTETLGVQTQNIYLSWSNIGQTELQAAFSGCSGGVCTPNLPRLEDWMGLTNEHFGQPSLADDYGCCTFEADAHNQIARYATHAACSAAPCAAGTGTRACRPAGNGQWIGVCGYCTGGCSNSLGGLCPPGFCGFGPGGDVWPDGTIVEGCACTMLVQPVPVHFPPPLP